MLILKQSAKSICKPDYKHVNLNHRNDGGFMSKETTTKVLEIDKDLNKQFDKYCQRKGIRYPRQEAAKLLEKVMKLQVSKDKRF